MKKFAVMWPLWFRMQVFPTAHQEICELVQRFAENDCRLGSTESAGEPCGWTKSSSGFDRLPGVLILELGWAEIGIGLPTRCQVLSGLADEVFEG